MNMFRINGGSLFKFIQSLHAFKTNVIIFKLYFSVGVMPSTTFISPIFLALVIFSSNPPTISSRSSRACRMVSVNETLDITYINPACQPRTVTTYSCTGLCPSNSKPVAVSGVFTRSCKCCSIKRSVHHVVTFKGCRNVLKRSLIKSCHCSECKKHNNYG